MSRSCSSWSRRICSDQEVAANPQHYRVDGLDDVLRMFLSSELCSVDGPDPARRARSDQPGSALQCLPLYLSRPLRRIDYFLGKLGVIAAFLGLVVIVPSLLAYVLGLSFSLDLTIVPGHLAVAACASLAYGLVIIVSAGTLMLALSSLSRNSRYVALFWLGLWIVSGITAIVLQSSDQIAAPATSFNRRNGRAGLASAPTAAASEWTRENATVLRSSQRRGQVGDRFADEDARLRKTELAAARLLSRPICRGSSSQLLGTDAAWKTAAAVAAAPAADALPADFGADARNIPGTGRPGVLGRPVRNFRMHPESFRPLAGPTAMTPIVEFHDVSKWYGNVIGINKLSLRIPRRRHRAARSQRRGQVDAAATGHRPALRQPGDGPRPRPAGLEQLRAQPPDRPVSRAGRVLRVDDRLGLRPHLARLAGISRKAARDAAEQTIDAVGMTPHQGRAIGGYSKGMRQRTKLAQALVHDPQVLFLDEPLTGTDPVARRDLMDDHPAAGRPGKERRRFQPRAARGADAHAEHRPAESRPAAWPKATCDRSAT